MRNSACQPDRAILALALAATVLCRRSASSAAWISPNANQFPLPVRAFLYGSSGAWRASAARRSTPGLRLVRFAAKESIVHSDAVPFPISS